MTSQIWKQFSFLVVVGDAGESAVEMLSYDPQLSRVRIDLSKAVSGTEPAGSYQVVERSTDLIHWTPVRGGSHVPIPES